MSDASSQTPPEEREIIRRFAKQSRVSRQHRHPQWWFCRTQKHRMGCRHSRPSRLPSTQGHRDRSGLRCRQTPLRRSFFRDPKTHSPGRSTGRSGRDGGASTASAGPPIGPPSQQVSRMAPHWRQISFARISWVSPEQIGQRQVLMPESIEGGRDEGTWDPAVSPRGSRGVPWARGRRGPGSARYRRCGWGR